MNCLRCNKDLPNITDGNQPMGGTEFVTLGHYGGGVFDPMDGSRMAINVCDQCLIEAQARNATMIYP